MTALNLDNILNAPRENFAYTPTPLIHLARLSKSLAGPQIYMKRDDCTGLASGGNKTRKLEFLITDAKRQNADTVITCGALQSNHARQTAAAAAMSGLNCELVLTKKVTREDDAYQINGNILLDKIYGAEIHTVNTDEECVLKMDQRAKKLSQQNKRPYIIPMGGSNLIGSMGYVVAIKELYQQCQAQDINASHLIFATCSGGTQAGLILGKNYLNWQIKLLGISAGPDKFLMKSAIQNIINTARIDFNDEIHVDDKYVGTGYGQPSPAALDAIKLIACTEGILLDPVYSGKAMSGLIDYIKQKHFKANDTVIFIHTGGSVALHAYVNEFS